MRTPIAVLSVSLSAILLSSFLAGCGISPTASPMAANGLTINGNVHGGQQPIVGAHVYLFAAATTGYGQPSVSLLVPSSTGFGDSVGGYVLTAADGSFTISGTYSCNTNAQVYALALGGNPGAGANSASGLMAVLGACPGSGSFATQKPFIYINEVSTVAAAYAMSGFAVDATHVSSRANTLSQSGISNAFANSGNLASLATGVALSTTVAGNGVVPQKTINTIANILTSCVNSTGPGSAQCQTLFNNAESNGISGVAPTETATAAINIAHNPGSQIATLFGLATPNAAFAPALTAQPNDFTIGINFSGGGISGANSLAVNSRGEVWFANIASSSITKLSSTGAVLSPPTGFPASGPTGIAIDQSDNAWVVDSVNSAILEYSNAGAPLSPTGGYTGGGLKTPEAVAIDGPGNVWAVNFGGNSNVASISEFSSAGVAISPSTGYTGGGLSFLTALAIDGFQSVWATDQQPAPGALSKFSNTGTPVSSSAGFVGGGINNPQGVAIDSNNNVWIANYGSNSVAKFSIGANVISPSTGYTGGGLSRPLGITIDGAGNVFTSDNNTGAVTQMNNAGVPQSPATGFTGGTITGPQGVAADGSGNLWVANGASTSVTELIGLTTPVVTPLSTGIKNNTLGTRP